MSLVGVEMLWGMYVASVEERGDHAESDTCLQSNPDAMRRHREYKIIVTEAPSEVVPALLHLLNFSPEPRLWVLRALHDIVVEACGVPTPVTIDHAGMLMEAALDWLEWGDAEARLGWPSCANRDEG